MMDWIDQKIRKPQPHVRVLVYINRKCSSEGALRGVAFAAWHGEEIGWVSDLLTPIEGVTHWAVISPPRAKDTAACEMALRNMELCKGGGVEG